MLRVRPRPRAGRGDHPHGGRAAGRDPAGAAGRQDEGIDGALDCPVELVAGRVPDGPVEVTRTGEVPGPLDVGRLAGATGLGPRAGRAGIPGPGRWPDQQGPPSVEGIRRPRARESCSSRYVPLYRVSVSRLEAGRCDGVARALRRLGSRSRIGLVNPIAGEPTAWTGGRGRPGCGAGGGVWGSGPPVTPSVCHCRRTARLDGVAGSVWAGAPSVAARGSVPSVASTACGSVFTGSVQRLSPVATSTPRATKLGNRSGAFSAGACDAAIVTALATPRAVAYSLGRISGPSGGPTLPPLWNAADAAKPAGELGPAALAASLAARRFSSLGSWTQASAARSAAATGSGGAGPTTSRTQRTAHQTASRLRQRVRQEARRVLEEPPRGQKIEELTRRQVVAQQRRRHPARPEALADLGGGRGRYAGEGSVAHRRITPGEASMSRRQGADVNGDVRSRDAVDLGFTVGNQIAQDVQLAHHIDVHLHVDRVAVDH